MERDESNWTSRYMLHTSRCVLHGTCYNCYIYIVHARLYCRAWAKWVTFSEQSSLKVKIAQWTVNNTAMKHGCHKVDTNGEKRTGT